MLRFLNHKGLSLYLFCLNNKVFGLSSKIGGASSEGLYEQYAHKFYNKDLANFKEKLMSLDPLTSKQDEYSLPGVNIITTPEECKKCVQILMKNRLTIVAWDTQTMDLDIKNQAPVGKGKIICASFFAGPQFNFGRGPRVFIDNFGTNAGLLDYFKSYLQSQDHLKVWHNYGFDRHIFYNHGINVRGFGGDTMHMARLYDSGKMFGQYSLAALTKEYRQYLQSLIKRYCIKKQKQLKQLLKQHKDDSSKVQQIQQILLNLKNHKEVYSASFDIAKTKMDELFKRKKVLKTGGQGASYQYPNTLTLHTNIEYIKNWISYSTLDSEATFYLRQLLELSLLGDKSKEYPGLQNMWKLYKLHWRPFGELLTDIEREGIKLDVDHMKKIEAEAKHDLQKKKDIFINFLLEFQNGKNIDHFNPNSSLQLQQLLYAPFEITTPPVKDNQGKGKKDKLMNLQDQELSNNCQDQSLYYQNSVKKIVRTPVTLNELVKTFTMQNKHGLKPKHVEMEVTGLGIPAQKLTPTGLPSVDSSVLQILAGDPQHQKFGKAYYHFQSKGNPQFGKKLCFALRTLVEYHSIQTLLTTFIEPLASYTDSNNRIHCSLNINTQTGRLSCRKPNLQNQPALDKDIYKIRKAFIADKGKKFIVADYGQLELRVLAHLTGCKAMIDAFKKGGDFHSRTAIGMYNYIKKDIEQGNILLEWDKSKGKPPVPLLKDKYAAERKKAKTVNFSIAYGKTAKGFALDWGCSLNQAKDVIKAWFSDRPQVKLWQQQKIRIATNKKWTQTLLGRFRKLDKFFKDYDPNNRFRGMMQRRAINTPIQGGAADIVIASMVKIGKNQKLKKLGWKLLLQIHDELILQGPQQSSAQALALVKHDMEHPFDKDLLVALQIDAKIGDNWYQCK